MTAMDGCKRIWSGSVIDVNASIAEAQICGASFEMTYTGIESAYHTTMFTKTRTGGATVP